MKNFFKLISLATASLFFSTALLSQTTGLIKGLITDTAQVPIGNATIKLKEGKDSLVRTSDAEGKFSIPLLRSSSFTMYISVIGFANYSKTFSKNGKGDIEVGNIRLEPVADELADVVVTGRTPVKVMEDTVQYDVKSLNLREGAPAEDAIKKLPGVTVDKDGKIMAQGKQVARVRVNGKDFFGGDVQTATQNLPAEILDNIQIIEDYGDEANITGVKTGDPETIININTRPDKRKGYFGNASAAGGTQERYVLGAMMNLFNNEQQISVMGSMNNTNTNTFDFNGGGRGGGARGANFGSEGRGGSGGNGLTDSKSIGLNYRDKWGKKISVYGSYSFSDQQNRVRSTTSSQDINPLNIRLSNSRRVSSSHSQNQRLTFNLEYNIDSFNYIKVSPFLSLSNNNNNNTGYSEISRAGYFTANTSAGSSSSHSPNGGGNFLYNHKFGRSGRNLSLSTSINYSDRSQENNTSNIYRNIDSGYTPPAIQDTIQKQLAETANKNTTSNARLSYREPLGSSKKHFLEASYEYNRSATSNEREVYNINPATGDQKLSQSQTNFYDYQFITHRAALRLTGRTEKYNYAVGVTAQPTILNGETIGKDIETHYTNTNWIPSARFVYNFARSNNLTVSFDGRSNQPNFMQLQPVADSSNLNNIVVGNPDLQAEFTNSFRLRYNNFNRQKGRSIFANFNYDKTNDKIVASRFNNPTGTGRTTSYLNTDGFYRLSANGSVTEPFANKKLYLTLRMDASYDNNISFTDNYKNKGQNWNLRPGLSFRVDINDVVDLDLNGSYNYYKTITRYEKNTTTNTANTWVVGLSGKNYFFKDLTIGYDLNKNINSGYGVASNPFIINVYAEYRFLKGKMATVRLQGFDLLNENTGISRSINGTTITDSQNNRLARYALLSFKIRIQKFGGGGNNRRGGDSNFRRGGRDSDEDF